MLRRLLSIVLPGMLLITAGPALADLTVTIVDTYGDPNSVTTMSGLSFDVVIRLDTDESLSALQLKFVDTSALGSFTLNSIVFSTPTAGVWSSDAADQLNPAPQTLDVVNGYSSRLIADLADDLVNGTGTGTNIDFVTLNLTFNGPQELATYDLNVADIVYGDLNFNEYNGQAGQSYQVICIPEPSVATLGVLGLILIGWLKKRRVQG